MLMPKNHPNTHHLEPYWLSDSPYGIRRARKETPRGHVCFKDLNLQALLDDDAFTHWGTPAKDGYRFIQVRPFKRRELTYHELHQPYHEWPAKKFKRLRRTRRAGKSYESRVKPMLYKRGLRVCKRWSVVPCVELKSWHYIDRGRCKRLITTAVALKVDTFFMALWKMGNCLRKGAAIISSGGKFAILAHGEHRPIELDQGSNYTEIWGSFS